MGSLLIFTGIGLALFAAALAALWWTVRSGQLDDLDTPALRMLGEDLPAADAAMTPRRLDPLAAAPPAAATALGATISAPRSPPPAPKP